MSCSFHVIFICAAVGNSWHSYIARLISVTLLVVPVENLSYLVWISFYIILLSFVSYLVIVFKCFYFAINVVLCFYFS